MIFFLYMSDLRDKPERVWVLYANAGLLYHILLAADSTIEETKVL